jgi:hypothetical protein
LRAFKLRKSVSVCTYSFLNSSTALVGLRLLIVEFSTSHSDTPHSVGLLWMSDRPMVVTSTWQHMQHSQNADIHAPARIQTRNPSKRSATDPCLRWCGHWDQLVHLVLRKNMKNSHKGRHLGQDLYWGYDPNTRKNYGLAIMVLDVDWEVRLGYRRLDHVWAPEYFFGFHAAARRFPQTSHGRAAIHAGTINPLKTKRICFI